ncbi:MAG TPA: 50S ribosomal protein L17 [Clostridiales bacterium]|nr:50S ribosomal protein L17 [Clostridiales bacterium]
MALQRKLGRPTDQRIAMMKGLVTALIQHGKIETTEARAMEVRKIAEKLITDAILEKDHFTSRQTTVSAAKRDSKGKILSISKTSKNGSKFMAVEREVRTELKTVDAPSRLHARRRAMNWLYKAKDADGNNLNLVNKLFDEIAPRYKEARGGYTRIYKLGTRRGDAAEIVLLELVN